MNEKYVKLSAIERMAESENKKEKKTSGEEMCVCPKCGCEYEHGSEEMEDEEE